MLVPSGPRYGKRYFLKLQTGRRSGGIPLLDLSHPGFASRTLGYEMS